VCSSRELLSRPDAASRGPGHPFPYISNLSLSLAVRVEDGLPAIPVARVKVRRSSALRAPVEQVRLVSLEQVIAANLRSLFPDMSIGAHHCFA